MKRERRFLVLADGSLTPLDAKTAVGALRFIPEQVAAVLDRSRAGRVAGEVLGISSRVPVVSSVTEGLERGANALLVGIAPVGGELPAEWRLWVEEGLRAGLDVWSGMHTFLSEDASLWALAAEHGARIFDLRRVPLSMPVAARRAASLPCEVLLTVGSDCNVGKMTATLELHRAALADGIRSRFVATGQTGVLVEGAGLSVDRMISDFAAGAVESMVMERSEAADVVMVEGQGSIFHPGYSGVTLSLLHGACPGAMVLCHHAGRTAIRHGGNPIPGYGDMVRAYETAASWVSPSRVIGVCVNTQGFPEPEALSEIVRAARETGLPACDPIRQGPGALLEALKSHLSARRSRA